MYNEVNDLVKRIEELEGDVLLKLDSDYLNLIYFNLPETHQKYWDDYDFEGDEWTAFQTFLKEEYKIAIKKRTYMESLKVTEEHDKVDVNHVHLVKSEEVDKISKDREKLWTSRQCVYTCIENNKDVS